MISYDFLESINAQLTDYRSDGKTLILFDSRDRTNYGDHSWPNTVALLKSADPTGLAVAMLISAKIDATIACSQVKLLRVLEEPGYLDEIKEIHRIRERLDEVLLGPLGVFMERVEFLITKVSPDFAKPTKREIAVSLRDAIYCISQGMKMSWVQCDGEQPNTPVGLHYKVSISDTLAGFVEMLKGDLPLGVHLAKVGHEATAIGFKKPGRIMYLSSMYLDVHTGRMGESQTQDKHMRDKLDLDGFDRRFPEWTTFLGRGKENEVAAEPQLKMISRDCMIWLAMMVELANQEVGRVTPSTIRLTESGKQAISHDSMVRSNLPVPYVPSWTLKLPSQAEVFESLGFAEWEKKYLGKLLEGVEEGAFLPIGDERLALRYDTKKQAPVFREGEPGYDYFKNSELSKNSSALTSLSESIAGTQEEVEAIALRIYQRNMSTWLMKLGNIQFSQQWKDDKEWFKKRLAKNAEKALNHDCASIIPEGNKMDAATVWEQSPKHTGFKALCFFNKKTMADTAGLLTPKTAKDIVAILGLKNEAALPEHLQGWSREQSWTTTNYLGADTPCIERWCFGDPKVTHVRGNHSYYQGVVHFHQFSHPLGTRKA